MTYPRHGFSGFTGLQGRPREECGVFAVYGHTEASRLTYFGLYALQHRGQESAGIVSLDGQAVREYKAMGLVHDIFTQETLDRLAGSVAVGHVRYSTTGSSVLVNTQPLRVQFSGTSMAVAHNGNLVNARGIRQEMEQNGSIFQTTMDSEVVLHLVARGMRNGIEEAVRSAMTRLKGAYSMLLMIGDSIIACRDPNGFRPLSIGVLDGAYVLSSETCAFDLVGARFLRDVEPGEICIIDRDGLRCISPEQSTGRTQCVFELIYFARPDSTVFGQNVYLFRKRQGEMLAAAYRRDVDLVMPFPDSGNYAAIGYARASGVPFEMGMIRNHYVGRTFIEPSQQMRDFGVKVKLNPVRDLLAGKRVLIIEDSIIRGTTSRTRIRTLRDQGIKEVHMLVSCPPHRFPCHYGIDFTSRGELVAADKTVDEIRDYIGLDSLGYLSLDDMMEASHIPGDHFCLACFNGCYPVAVEEGFSKTCLE